MIDKNLPLIDLHRHLDGNVRLETILDLGRQHNLPLPAWDLEGLRPHVQVVSASMPGVMAFIAKFRWMTEVLVDYEACRRVAYENVQDAQQEGIDYIELRFSPWFMAETHNLDPRGVVEAVVDGAEAGSRDLKVKVNLIGIISRTYGPDACRRELEALLHYRDRLVALDLAGDGRGTWAGGSRSTPGNRRGQRASGRPCASWGPHASGTPSRPLRIRPCWTIWPNARSASNRT